MLRERDLRGAVRRGAVPFGGDDLAIAVLDDVVRLPRRIRGKKVGEG
jgi:hypothetical protein